MKKRKSLICICLILALCTVCLLSVGCQSDSNGDGTAADTSADRATGGDTVSDGITGPGDARTTENDIPAPSDSEEDPGQDATVADDTQAENPATSGDAETAGSTGSEMTDAAETAGPEMTAAAGDGENVTDPTGDGTPTETQAQTAPERIVLPMDPV